MATEPEAPSNSKKLAYEGMNRKANSMLRSPSSTKQSATLANIVRCSKEIWRTSKPEVAMSQFMRLIVLIPHAVLSFEDTRLNKTLYLGFVICSQPITEYKVQ